ncbi:MAG TPA: peptidase, partial [Bacilli bacterium]|nr:peptidase [Bacilli bacterium]
MQPWAIVVLSIVGAIVLLILVSSIKIVRQTDKYVIERLGGYLTTWGVGIHMLIPFFDRISQRVTMKEQVKDFDPQPVITK